MKQLDFAAMYQENWDKLHKKSDFSVEIILWFYLALGFFLAFFYDTFLVAAVVGSLSMGIYYSTKLLFRKNSLHHYMASLVVGIFMAQFIYQMHGLFEMHFTAFIGLIVLITYQNWKTMFPLSLFVVVHHASFAYIQYLGVIRENDSLRQIYFTQLAYMDLTTFVFHAALYTVGAAIAGIYSFQAKKNTNAQINRLIALKTIEEQTLANTAFAKQIAQHNFQYQTVVDEEDTLAKALSDMRDNLRESKEKEIQDRFLNKGMADVAEIVRKSSLDSSNLAENLISYLVKYLQGQQGAIFFLEDQPNGQSLLVMKGCYAYDRKKFVEKQVEPGEGLVGQCFLERAPIILNAIPKDYTKISTGLGETEPNFLLLVPMKNEENVMGVVEIASLNPLPAYYIDFLSKAGETISSALHNVRLNEKTQHLLEESQKREEQMRSQEEELRQNLEEMAATQEELHRRNLEFLQKEKDYNQLSLKITQLENEVALYKNSSIK